MSEPITEDWLKSVGFKWEQFERQPSKHWLLWLGDCLECDQGFRFSGNDNIGIQLAFNDGQRADWFCWFRGDSAGRYHRFIHVRHLRYQREVISLVQAITGHAWRPENHMYGCHRCQKCADRSREEDAKRLDRQIRQSNWYEAEKDDTRAGADALHLDAAIKGGKAK